MNNYPKTYVARVLMSVVGNDGDVVMRTDYDKALLRITELEKALEAAQKDAARSKGSGTTHARFIYLIEELQKRFPDQTPFSAEPPEIRILKAIDAAIAKEQSC